MARTSATNRTRKTAPQEGAWPFVFSVFLLSRLLFLAVGALAAALLPWAKPGGFPLEPPGFLNYWAHWDGAWYSEIATKGYGAHAPASTAFFPVYPMLVRFGAYLGGGAALWGVLISLVATLFTFYFLYRIAESLRGVYAARATVIVLAFFPTAFYMNAVYTEALFLAFSTGCVWAAHVRRDLLLAGILGALAAATRNVGVLLLLPLLYEWYRNRREFGRTGLLEIGAVPVGLVAYLVFLAGRFGDPLIFANEQSAYWNRSLTNPATALNMAWRAAGIGVKYLLDPAALFLGRPAAPALLASNTLNLAFLVLFLLLAGISFAVLPPGLSLYAFIITLVPVLSPSPSFPLLGFPRYLLAAFPLFIALGYLLSRSRTVLVLWLVVSIVLGVALTALFTTWRFVA